MVEYYDMDTHYIDAEDEGIEREFDEEDQYERQQELLDDQTPTFRTKDDLFSLFWKVINVRDSSKVGNLNKTELGLLDISVRDCQRIALLADILGHPGFAKYFRAQAELILATSSSREGWLPSLFVSQKKLSAKQKQTPLVSVDSQPRTKKGLFGKKK